MTEPEDEDRGSWLKRTGPAVDAGWTLSGSVIGCLLIGYALGEYFDKNPAATLIGLFTGIVVGLYNLARIMLRKK
jgi:F0F1-type ATP synthase assembly protein I